MSAGDSQGFVAGISSQPGGYATLVNRDGGWAAGGLCVLARRGESAVDFVKPERSRSVSSS